MKEVGLVGIGSAIEVLLSNCAGVGIPQTGQRDRADRPDSRWNLVSNSFSLEYQEVNRHK